MKNINLQDAILEVINQQITFEIEERLAAEVDKQLRYNTSKLFILITNCLKSEIDKVLTEERIVSYMKLAVKGSISKKITVQLCDSL